MKKEHKKAATDEQELEQTASQQTEEQAETEQESNAQEAAELSEEAKQLAELAEKFSEQHELLLRTAAEYENFRKRSALEKQNAYTMAKSDAISQLLPIADTLERALSVDSQSVEDYKKGMELTQQQMTAAFEKLGIEKISAERGDKFDPELHNAVMHIEDDSLEQNVIAQCFQTGYKLGDKVIRHSMVQVAN